MRMRKKKNLGARLEACADLMIKEPQKQKGNFNSLFSQPAKLYLEIGAGKGGFSRKMCAVPERDFNFIAMEKAPEAMVMAMEKTKTAQVKDLLFLVADAAGIVDIFADNEVDRLFLNFSDPWPQSKRAKRRLTHENFLKQYQKILKAGGEICFKTDNQALFEFSLAEFSKCGFILKDISLNLHSSKYAGDNNTTEYEEKFAAQGLPIYRCVAVNQK